MAISHSANTKLLFQLLDGMRELVKSNEGSIELIKRVGTLLEANNENAIGNIIANSGKHAKILEIAKELQKGTLQNPGKFISGIARRLMNVQVAFDEEWQEKCVDELVLYRGIFLKLPVYMQDHEQQEDFTTRLILTGEKGVEVLRNIVKEYSKQNTSAESLGGLALQKLGEIDMGGK